MMPAAKHGDPQFGIDIHLCTVPPGVPAPLPTPHMSIVFDPMDYVPFIGATVTVCGMKRAVAGTAGQVVHIPPGFPFAPKLPDKEDELFMGSATVQADGDPFSHLAHPVLACQVVGMPSPFRLKRKGGPRMMMLPTVFNLAIPSTVFIGGPPTISLMSMAFKAGFALLGKLAKAAKGVGKRFKAWRKAKFGHLSPGFLKCKILRAEPVNIITGAVSVEQDDFTLAGIMPIRWNRQYASDNPRRGACGAGWECPADARLELDFESGVVLFRHPEGDIAIFEGMPGAIGESGAVLELMDGALLIDSGDELLIRTKEDRTYRFPKALAVDTPAGEREFPLARIDDRCGNSLIYERSAGRVTAIREPGGRRIGVEWIGGQISRVTLQVPGSDHQHLFVEYEQDGAGDLVAVRDALGNPYRFAYEQHHMVRHTDRNGLSFYYEYDHGPDDWRVVRAWGDGGLYAYRFEYLDAIDERRITDSLGGVTTIKLDERGLPISEIDPLGGMTIFEYDDAGRTTAVVDPAGRRTEYHFDDFGNLVELIRPDESVVATEYEWNKPVRITDPNGGVWEQRWDERGLLLSQTDPLGHLSRFEHDNRGLLAAHVNARGARTQTEFDGFANLLSILDPLGHPTHYTYNLLGDVVVSQDALNRSTRYGYDPKRRLLGVQLPSGATIGCDYDGEDNLTRYTDENGATTRIDYFGQGEIARRVQPDGHTVEYLYDTEEQLVGVRNQRGETYQLHRDALGRVVEEVDYWGQIRRFAYDAGGYLAATVDPLNRRIDYACDPLGRILEKLMADPAGKPFAESFAYDPAGNLVAMANPHVEVSRSFDALGQLVAETQAHAMGESFTIENRYDAVGNRIRRTTANSAAPGHEVEFTYDLNDLCVGAGIDDAPPMTFGRDPLGQVIAEQWSPEVERALSYTQDGQLAGQSVSKGSAALFSVSYDYDPAGNLTRRTDSVFGVESFVYDPIGRLLEHVDPRGRIKRFFNDPAGDRLATQVVGMEAASVDVSDDGWRREGRHDDTHYSFNRAGNLVERYSDDHRLALHWDANQRLVATTQTDRDGTRTDTVYAYDPSGRRLFKETAGSRTWFGWDDKSITLDVVDDRPREFIYRPESFEPLAMLAQAAYVYSIEPNGAPTRLLAADGSIVWSATYAPWGEADERISEISNPLRLQGQYYDEETSLSYNCNRYFDGRIGAFISQDPLGLDVGENVYEFGPNTLNWQDPLGLACHANSKISALPNHVYEIRNKKTGEVFKFGISSGRIRLDGKSSRAEKQVRALNTKHGADIFESRIVKSDVSRQKALSTEQGLVNSYSIARQRLGLASGPTAPLGNIRPTAKM